MRPSRGSATFSRATLLVAKSKLLKERPAERAIVPWKANELRRFATTFADELFLAPAAEGVITRARRAKLVW